MMLLFQENAAKRALKKSLNLSKRLTSLIYGRESSGGFT